MNRALGQRGIQLGAVALGWIVAVVVAIVLGAILAAIFGGSNAGGVTTGEAASVGIIGLIAAFLAYVAGGYVAGSRTNAAKPLNGAMTAVFGLIVGIILAIILSILLLLTGGTGFPPGPLGLGAASGGGFISVLIAFLVNLAGGYVGGKVAESRS